MMRKGNTMKTRMTLLALVSLLVLLTGAGLSSAQDDTLQIWTKFNDQEPQNTQDVWMQDTITEYAEATGVTLENTFLPFDQINSRLNLAALAGGDVPDVSYVDSQYLGLYFNNGTLMDLTEFVQNAEWFDDIDPIALAACTAPDGAILCVPSTTAVHFMYYWTDYYPDGFPATTDEMLAAAADFEAGTFPLTFKGAEVASIERVYYGLIRSFGGDIADVEGRAIWANDDVVTVLEYVRELFNNDYVPDVALTTGFDFEEPFKQGMAGGFYAGSYSYVFLSPLTSPDGTTFEAEVGSFDPEGLAVGDAFEAGEIAFAPPVAAPGGEPQTLVLASAWGIPTGAENVEAAQAFIDYQMQTPVNVELAVAYGALPTLQSALDDEAFATGYWQAVRDFQSQYAIAAPTLLDYDLGMQLLSDAIVNIITDPNADIMQELEFAQEEYNFAIE